MIEDAIFQYSQLGFSYAVSIFLLLKGAALAEKYTKTLTLLEENMKTHAEESRKALEKLLNKTN